jgi:hypothetical protein
MIIDNLSAQKQRHFVYIFRHLGQAKTHDQNRMAAMINYRTISARIFRDTPVGSSPFLS